MDAEFELIEEIHRYLHGKMSAGERQAFEKQMDSDPHLQKEVMIETLFISGIQFGNGKQPNPLMKPEDILHPTGHLENLPASKRSKILVKSFLIYILILAAAVALLFYFLYYY